MFKKILCPTDLEDRSLTAIAKAVELARLCRSELVLLNVRPEFMSKEEMVMLRVSPAEFQRDERNIAVAAKRIVEAELAKVGGSDIPHEVVLREGDPHKEIIETAQELCCDLIVLTTTGRDSLLEHIKGSGTERIVSVSHVPVLVLPLA
jgi:nucleotide-binding universal stress UspA family protein